MELSELAQVGLSKLSGFADNANLRHFWVYVLCGMAIAFVAHRIGGEDRGFLSVFFRREVWRSRSAFIDYVLIIANPIIFVLALDWIFTSLWKLSPVIANGIRSLGTDLQSEGGSVWAAVGLTITLYVVNDFMRWWMHYLQHKVPFLWEFHKVHHSAEQLNFATAERHHPFDAVFFSFGTVGAAAIVNGIFLGLFGDSLTLYQVGGANIIFFGSNLIGGVLRHSPIWVSYGPKLEKWLISPAMHQIHHSSDPKHWDKNMGGGLAIWDRIGGTLYVPKGREELNFGIGPDTKDFRTLYGVYVEPVIKAARIFQRD